MIKEDCFAYRQKFKRPMCVALNEYEPMICRYKDKCPFYKTEAQYEAGIKLLERKEAERKVKQA